MLQRNTVAGTSYRRGSVRTCTSRVARHSERLGHGDPTKVFAQLVCEVREVGLLEHRPVRQRNFVVHDGQLIVNCAPGSERFAIDVDHSRDGVWPSIHRRVRGRPRPIPCRGG